MIMEIYLNENKAKDNNIDIESCYKKIDNYFLTRGLLRLLKVSIKEPKKILQLLQLLKDNCQILTVF